MLPKLQTGLDVNVKFTGIRDFEYTPEYAIFDLLKIPLYHGWLVDPQMSDVMKAVGKCSYNELIDKVINGKCSTDIEIVSEAHVAEIFLEETASQLTQYGLCELTSKLKEDELCTLFRNNHFSSLIKHKSSLYELVTDEGFVNTDVVWQTLNNIEGDCEFLNSTFHLVKPQLPVLLSKAPKQSDETCPSNLQPMCAFWDIQNIAVPHNIKVGSLVNSVRQEFFTDKYEADFIVVCDIELESRTLIEELLAAEVTIIHTYASAKNTADRKLILQMQKFVAGFGHQSTVLLITGDGDFAHPIRQLRAEGIKTIVLHRNNPNQNLLNAAGEHHHLDDILSKTPVETLRKEGNHGFCQIAEKDKSKHTQDPNTPTRNLSAFCIFANVERPKVKETMPESTIEELGIELGRRWNSVSPTTKFKYEALAAKDKARYVKIMLQQDRQEGHQMAEKDEKNSEFKLANYKPVKGQEKGSKKRKRTKDLNAPKRPRSSIFYFDIEERPKIKESLPDLTIGKLGVVIFQHWKDASKDKKAKYEALAAKDKARYMKEMKAYKGGAAVPTKKIKAAPAKASNDNSDKEILEED